jgi:hypothetical protein
VVNHVGISSGPGSRHAAAWPTFTGTRIAKAAEGPGCPPARSSTGTPTREPRLFRGTPVILSRSSELRRLCKRQMLMTRRTWGEGDLIVNDRDCWRRVSQATTIIPSVDALMSSTLLKSMTMGASLSEIARSKVRRRSGSVAMSCSPRSQMMVGPVSRPAPGGGGRSATVTKEDPARAIAILLTLALQNFTPPGSGVPSRPVRAGSARRVFTVPRATLAHSS